MKWVLCFLVKWKLDEILCSCAQPPPNALLMSDIYKTHVAHLPFKGLFPTKHIFLDHNLHSFNPIYTQRRRRRRNWKNLGQSPSNRIYKASIVEMILLVKNKCNMEIVHIVMLIIVQPYHHYYHIHIQDAYRGMWGGPMWQLHITTKLLSNVLDLQHPKNMNSWEKICL